jgi:hypothetical protein
MKHNLLSTLLASLSLLISVDGVSQDLARAPEQGTQTRWVSPENPGGEKGKGGLTNKGAKGNAFFIVQPGARQVLFDVKGAGIINRMWMSGSIGVDSEQRRAVRIDMYWDGSEKPAVSAPIGDFFGIGLGLLSKFDSELFTSPEARSFNFFIPMPFRKSAFITITNESSKEVWIWYDINYLKADKLPADLLYFHAYWNRDLKTKAGRDYEILPRVTGTGRYVGANISVIGDTLCRGAWFGEGEVKIYLDGDSDTPTLVGTGTEDYIGSGWGQGEFACRYFGSPVSDRDNDLYSFYRYHIPDPVYFHRDCKVTIQQMGNDSKENILKMIARGADIKPVWFLDQTGKETRQGRLLEDNSPYSFTDPDFPGTGGNFYRSDDVSATAYFYLDKPSNDLPELPPAELRLKYLRERVWSVYKKK